MSWREVETSKTRGTTHVIYRCGSCGFLACASPPHKPSRCVCQKK